MTDYLTVSDVLQIMGRKGFELRDSGLLEAAIARPRSSAFGQDAFPGLYQKAAALLQSLAANQSLIDGNKRLGWFCVNAFLELNGVELGRVDPDEAEPFISSIDHHTDVDVIAERLKSWTAVIYPEH